MNRLYALVLSLTLAVSAHAQAPQPPEVNAKSFLVLDLTSNQTLAERNADVPSDPASLTKLMSLYVVFTAIHDKKLTLEQRLPVSKRAWDERKAGGSLMFIDTTMTPKVDELLQAARLCKVRQRRRSGIGRRRWGARVDEFVAMMNRQAQALGPHQHRV